MITDLRFKELVNLHLDLRLSPEEARELEQALEAEPARRRQLASYVNMQRGCAELFRRSAAGAPTPELLLRSLRQADRRVNEQKRERTGAWGWDTWGSLSASAAAIAAAFLILQVNQSPTLVVNESVTPNIGVAASDSNAAGTPSLVVVNEVSGAPACLPPHLALAALGIAHDSREVGAVSRWSYLADDSTEQEEQRAVAWSRGLVRPEWRMDATTVGRYNRLLSSGTKEGAGQPEFQASAASFIFER